MKNTLLFTYSANILVRLLTVNMSLLPNKIRKCDPVLKTLLKMRPHPAAHPISLFSGGILPRGGLRNLLLFQKRLKIAWNSLHTFLCSLVLKSWLHGPCTALWMEMTIFPGTPTEKYYQPNTYWSQVQQICWSHVSCFLQSWPPLLSVWCPNERHLLNITLNETTMTS